jgi:hypothetical protein
MGATISIASGLFLVRINRDTVIAIVIIRSCTSAMGTKYADMDVVTSMLTIATVFERREMVLFCSQCERAEPNALLSRSMRWNLSELRI